MNYENIGSFIMNKRKEKNMTQKELAQKLNITDKAVSKWERGLGCPDVSILEDLSKVLEVSILEILKGRALEQEELQQEKIEHYVLETLDYSNQEIKRKYKNGLLNIFTIIIIGISSFLLFINIHHIRYLNYTYAYNFDNRTIKEMKEDLSLIENNMEKIKNNQGILKEEDYQEIINILEKEYHNYKELNLWNYQGVQHFKSNDLYQLNPYLSTYGFLPIYNILSEYDPTIENKKSLYLNQAIIKGILASNTFEHAFYEYQYQMLPFQGDDISLPQDKANIKMLYISSLLKEFLQITETIIEVGDIHE